MCGALPPTLEEMYHYRLMCWARDDTNLEKENWIWAYTPAASAVYKGMNELSGSSRCRGALCGQREESSAPASLQCVAWLPAFCLASTGSLCSCI